MARLRHAHLSEDDVERILDEASLTADPDACVLHYVRLREAIDMHARRAQILSRLSDSAVCRAVYAILGFSPALSDVLIAHPWLIESLEAVQSTEGGVSSAGASSHAIPNYDDETERQRATAWIQRHDPARASVVDWMRLGYYARLIPLVAADLCSPDSEAAYADVSRSLSALAAGAVESALVIARSRHPEAADAPLAIIGMGKTGGQELNYVSDVDVLFACPDGIATPDQYVRSATVLAQELNTILSGPGSVHALWPLDTTLRPEGKNGVLVRTLDAMDSYYRTWAHNWEFQALLKARPLAGDLDVGQQFVDMVQPMIWQAAARPHFVADAYHLRTRVQSLVGKANQFSDIKLAEGGLRDIEFSVQLLQLVHGRTDSSLRVRSTIDGLSALSAGGYVSRTDASALDHDYRALRVIEHRMQLRYLRRTHEFPPAPGERRILARSIISSRSASSSMSADDLVESYTRMKREIVQLKNKIYFRPILPVAAGLPADGVSLSPQAAHARLAAIGYQDPVAAMNHIRSLTQGTTRTAAIQKQLLPAFLHWFAQAPRPDAGLLAFRQLSEHMGHTSWYMRILRDGGPLAQRLCHLLASSELVAQYLPRIPEALMWLSADDDLVPRPKNVLEAELAGMMQRVSTPEEANQQGRFIRFRESLRTAMACALRLISEEQAAHALCDATDIAAQAALDAALTSVAGSREDALVRMLVIAAGSWGGYAMGFASDADAVVIYQAQQGADPVDADQQAVMVAQRFSQLMSSASTEPGVVVDMDLRPEGKQGAMAKSLTSYASYLQRWALPWEKLASLRMRAAAGDAELIEQWTAVVDAFRYPAGGIPAGEVASIRRIKARIEAERIPAGVPAQRHIKLGPGGMTDIDFCAQLIQLQSAGSYPSLRSTHTVDVLRAAQAEGLMDSSDASVLIQAYLFSLRLRHVRSIAGAGRKANILPHDPDDLDVCAYLLGRDESDRSIRLAEDYQRAARRARSLVMQYFYGVDDHRSPM
ncbi:MAG: bifunctional [glutamine synthetase] adenylyltransferase/[glutamine synthetase]-adenylyl-L-tyrosine phosphorylase [Actinomycetaceae bacterium]|nr:bifunctional [glutamine synthetase] adenylyltransferase/[glutamine synthetase]-adenylyl-L-tyrosine phosphorylase [Actinomycetaceae bacterium]MDY6083064.1 bifunctional [glutamine synthetase] adenylyltransferase/[glutamine synthetase]-adenylyl-L-tyrosine phosphorylase [Actinomycetaceae bacterium]